MSKGKSPKALRDLTGKRFGKLKVISRAPNGPNWKVYWNCVCDCGGTSVSRTEGLVTGHTRSCGCLQREAARRTGRSLKIDPNQLTINNARGNWSRAAKKRGLEFELSPHVVESLIFSNCKYCGAEPASCNELMPSKYNGIDRVNSEKGYTVDNVVTCCPQCNYAKMDYSEKEFKQWITKLYQHMEKANV